MLILELDGKVRPVAERRATRRWAFLLGWWRLLRRQA